MDTVETTWRVSPSPNQSPDEYLLFRRHLFAYEQAVRRQPSGAVAVDVACGLGYALAPLSARFLHVLAMDIAATPLRKLESPAITGRIQADAGNLPLADRSVDLLLAFQLLEHVPESKGVDVLREARRVLRQGGRAFFTTPNRRWRLLPGQAPWNPYHVLEYGPRRIRRLCSAAGIGESQIRGVVGLGGAQELERDRVRQDPLQLWSGGIGRAIRQMLPMRKLATKTVQASMAAGRLDWFELASDYSAGLDFWIEVTGD